MKKVLTIIALALLCLPLAVIARETDSGAKEKLVSGTIARIDMAQKAMTVTDAKGMSWTFHWNDSTRMLGGEMKEGSPVQLGYVEAQNKMWAAWIRVGEAGK